jgi:putative tryptophan/tyrosine transport system substrate-binding protein
MPDMRRRQVISLLGSLAAAWPVTANAQRAEMPLIGFLGSASPDAFANRLRSFRQGLSEVGYVEGQNLGIEFRWANNQLDRLPALAADLVRRGVTIIAAPGSTAAASAAKAATTNIRLCSTLPLIPLFRALSRA